MEDWRKKWFSYTEKLKYWSAMGRFYTSFCFIQTVKDEMGFS